MRYSEMVKNKKVTLEDRTTSTDDCLSLNEIISYSNGQMNPEKKKQLELHVHHCDFCAEAIRGFQKSSGETQFRTAIDDIQKLASKKLNRTKSRWRTPMLRYGIAALVILALVSAFILSKINQPHQRIFRQFFEVYPNITPIVRGESSPDIFIQAMMNYESDQIAICQQLLDQLLKLEPQNVGAHFYAGMCRLINNKPQLALSHFKAISKTPNSPYFDPAQWYQGLTLVKLERIPDAKAVFQNVSATSTFQERSERILKLLSEN